VLDAELTQLPARQPRSLQQRAGLVDQHVPEGAVVVQRADDAERGAPAEAGEGAGVAVRMDPEPARPRAAHVAQVGGAALADADALGGRVAHRAHREGLDRRGAVRDRGRRRLDLAPQVHRGRPGLGDPLDLRPEARVVPALAPGLPDRERDAQRAGRAEQRRAADGQPADRVYHLVHGGDPQHADLMRQGGLVEGGDVTVLPRDSGLHVVNLHPGWRRHAAG